MIPTPCQIDAQVELERRAISCGIDALHANTRSLEQKSYASASVYGVSSIDALMPVLMEEIDKKRLRIMRGRSGPGFSEVRQHLKDLDTLIIAGISAKVVFDTVFSSKEGCNEINNVAVAMASGLEGELQLRAYESVAPQLVNIIKRNYWHKSCGTQQKRSVMRIMMNRNDYGHAWKAWDGKIKARIGHWLLDCICCASGWFRTQFEWKGKNSKEYVVPTEALLAIKDDIMRRSELFAPIAWPMLVPPKDWTDENPGGYLLNEVMRGHDMVRRGFKGPLKGGQTIPVYFLNQIQKTAWRVNPFIYGVAKELMDREISVGKFIPSWNETPPPKPPGIDEDEERRKDYKKAKTAWHNRMRDNASRCVRTMKAMECAEMFVDKDRYYLPWSFDFRGRAYPIPAYLSPQDSDFGKSLLYFADPSYVTPDSEDWLAFQVATTYGLDKAPLDERIAWTKANVDLVRRVVEDPVGSLPEWEAADEPWTFLAACEEYLSCVVDCSRQFTGLPVATDATCSGLQILAGLTQDAATARMVNVLPSPTPQDAYKVVAEAARPHCPEHLQQHIDRKVTKRVVMTIPYNAKKHSNRGYIREALKEKGVEISKEDLTILTNEIRSAMERTFPGAMSVMSWIEDVVRQAFKDGAEDLRWISPSGFEVVQHKNIPNITRQKTMLMGEIKKRIVYLGDSDKPNIRKHKDSTSPNLIHSLDASLLHISISRFRGPVGLIHDSVMCTAADMGVMSSIVRQVYAELFARKSYLHEWAEQIGSQSQPPVIGTLDAELVNESTYFFC